MPTPDSRKGALGSTSDKSRPGPATEPSQPIDRCAPSAVRRGPSAVRLREVAVGDFQPLEFRRSESAVEETADVRPCHDLRILSSERAAIKPQLTR